MFQLRKEQQNKPQVFLLYDDWVKEQAAGTVTC